MCLAAGAPFPARKIPPALRVIDADNKQWLIDCGPTVPRALWQRGGEVNDIDAIYFTHVHPDHCTGLTALLNHWKSYSRQKPVIIYCQPAQQPVLMQLAALANWPQADLGFTIDWQECREALDVAGLADPHCPHPA